MRHSGPGAGILVGFSLPYRLLQIHFADLVLRLGSSASAYGNLLTAFAALTAAAFLVALYGRAIFVKSCRMPPASWRELLSIRPDVLLTYVYRSVLIQLALILFAVTLLAIPLVIILAGLAAAATLDRPTPGLIAPVRALGRYTTEGRSLAGLTVVFFIALLLAAVNVYFLAMGAVWLAGGIPGVDAVKMQALLSHSTRMRLAVVVCAITAVEPFFLAAMHVYAERMRSRHSGDDLRRRFAMLREQSRRRGFATASVMVAVLLLFAHVGAAATGRIDIHLYASELADIRDDLHVGRFREATARIDALGAATSVVASNTTFEPDRSLLAIARGAASEGRGDMTTLNRLSATVDALRSGGLEIRRDFAAADLGLLGRVRAAQKIGELPRGGNVQQLPVSSAPVFEHLRSILGRAFDWLAEKLGKIVDWIIGLWPERADDDQGETFFGLPVVVWVVTLTVVAAVLVLAAYVMRRSRRRTAPVLGDRVTASAADADPLSRQADEWERYATELAASGRIREAIRAWYHAVLVTLCGAGIVHYRKGSTNWEYVRALPPALSWRARFISITRKFESEWYGHRESAWEALESCASDGRAILAAMREVRR